MCVVRSFTKFDRMPTQHIKVSWYLIRTAGLTEGRIMFSKMQSTQSYIIYIAQPDVCILHFRVFKDRKCPLNVRLSCSDTVATPIKVAPSTKYISVYFTKAKHGKGNTI